MSEELLMRIMNLENEVLKLRQQMVQVTPAMGNQETYHKPFDMDGDVGMLSHVLEHGNRAQAGQEMDKACLRIGSTHLYAMDRTGQTGPVGLVKGVGGDFVSKVDSIPADEEVVLP